MSGFDLRSRKRGGVAQVLLVLLVFGFADLADNAYGQYFDFSARSSAEEYLRMVEKKKGEGVLSKFSRSDALFLASTFGQLDRLTIPPGVFLEHLELANQVRNRFYPEIPEESFRQYLLALRIRAELTENAGWRKRLASELAPVVRDGMEIGKAAGEVFSWVRRKVRLSDEARTYPLNLKGDLDPLTTLKGGWGSETDVAILAVAALRSVGMAARIVYAPVIANEHGGKVWVEYRDRKEWKPWVPSAPPQEDMKRWLNRLFSGKWAYILANPQEPINITPSYTPTETLWLSPAPLSVEKFDATAMVLSNGQLQPVSGRDIYNIEPGNGNRGLGGGRYFIAAGDYKTLGSLKPVELKPGSSGWYVMDFEGKKQFYEQAKERPKFFEWAPEASQEEEAW